MYRGLWRGKNIEVDAGGSGDARRLARPGSALVLARGDRCEVRSGRSGRGGGRLRLRGRREHSGEALGDLRRRPPRRRRRAPLRALRRARCPKARSARAPRRRRARSRRGNGPIDPDRLAATLAPDIELVDHRHLGTWSARGGRGRTCAHCARSPSSPAELRAAHRATCSPSRRRAPAPQRRTSASPARQRRRLRAAASYALRLRSRRSRARDRALRSRPRAEALARFDALTARRGAAPPPPRARRTPRAAAIARVRRGARRARRRRARGGAFDAVPRRSIDHPTGATYGRARCSRRWRSDAGASDLDFRTRSRSRRSATR